MKYTKSIIIAASLLYVSCSRSPISRINTLQSDGFLDVVQPPDNHTPLEFLAKDMDGVVWFIRFNSNEVLNYTYTPLMYDRTKLAPVVPNIKDEADRKPEKVE